jgi:hypothetical protein
MIRKLTRLATTRLGPKPSWRRPAVMRDHPGRELRRSARRGRRSRLFAATTVPLRIRRIGVLGTTTTPAAACTSASTSAGRSYESAGVPGAGATQVWVAPVYRTVVERVWVAGGVSDGGRAGVGARRSCRAFERARLGAGPLRRSRCGHNAEIKTGRCCEKRDGKCWRRGSVAASTLAFSHPAAVGPTGAVRRFRRRRRAPVLGCTTGWEKSF